MVRWVDADTQDEIDALRAERDAAVAEVAALKIEIERMRDNEQDEIRVAMEKQE